MRALITSLLCCLLVPALATADRSYRDSRHPGRYYSSDSYGPGYRSHPHYTHQRHHNDDWMVPLAIVGGLVGIVALSEMNRPPPPPQRMCRDTYNYYDEYGRYLYSRSMDRPCF